MAFSLFGKRPKDPDARPSPDDEAPPALEEQRAQTLAAAPPPLPDDTPAPRTGFFDRMRQAVSRTRENLSQSLNSVIALTREVDQSTLDSLEPLLLAADVGSATSAIVLEALRQRALRKGIESGAELKTLLKLELQHVLDRVVTPIAHPASGPEVIMMVGVNGTGKTTTSGKLAAHFSAQHRSVLLCAADTFRAAAIEQLEVWAQRSGVALIKTKQGGDPSAALYDACTASKARGIQVLIVDTAGRLHTKTLQIGVGGASASWSISAVDGASSGWAGA